MPEPLEGIRVVEAGIAVVGPIAGVFLADMGAEVIKIETPLGIGNQNPPEAPGPWMVAANRGKKSLQLDLATPEGQAAVHRLIATADVFLTNFRQDGLVHMGLDEPTLRSVNRRLVYALCSGFGPRGPDAAAAMLDVAVQARGGLLNMIGPPDEAPYVVGSVIGDTAGGMLLALSVMTALVVRERTGVGQRVDTSALGAQLFLQAMEIDHTGLTGHCLSRQGRFSSNINGMYGAYATVDDRLIVLGMVRAKDWPDFCAFCGLADLADHPVWSNVLLRSGFSNVDIGELRDLLAQGVRSHTLQEWVAFLHDRPNIVYGVVQTYDEVLADPQVLANDYVTEIDVSGLGRRRIIGNLVGFSATPASAKTSIPGPGEHNVELLRSVGMSDGEIAALSAQLPTGAQRMIAKQGV